MTEDLILEVPMVTKIIFLLTILLHNQKKSLRQLKNDHLGENALIFYQILLTYY